MARSPSKQNPVAPIDTVSLADLSRTCGVHAEWIIELVEQGILDPEGTGPAGWQFSAVSITKVKTAWRLHRDLGINQAGIAVTLDLIEERNILYRRLRRYERSTE